MRFNPKAKTDQSQVTFSRKKHYVSPVAQAEMARAYLRWYTKQQKRKRLK